MATTTGPDLAAAVAAVERLMDDTCDVTRDPEGDRDAVLDQETGQLVDPAPSDAVYSGKCMVSRDAGGQAATEAGLAFVGSRYRVTIPLSAPALEPGDLVTVTSARRDPELTGLELVVVEPVLGTMAVSRKAYCERRQ